MRVVVEQLVVGVGELANALVVADLAREDAAASWAQVVLAPLLVEEGEREDARAVGDLGLEDRAAALPHVAHAYFEHLRHDGHVLVERQARKRGELAPHGVAARIVAEHLPDRAVAECALDGLRRAPAERAREAGVEGEPTGARGIRSFGRHSSIVGSAPVSAANSACT